MKSTLAVPITSALLILSIPAFSQAYKTAAGVRFDKGFNITLQQYIQDGWTAEGILHTPILSNNFGATILGEKHQKIMLRGVNFYAGAGLHYYWKANANRNTSEVKHHVFGLTGIAGLEFGLGRLNLSVDWKPELHLAGDQAHPFDWNGAAISARYIIEKRERRKIKDWKIWDKIKNT